jgi:hypothetical protein
MPRNPRRLTAFRFGPWNLSEGVDSFGSDVRRGDNAEDLEILRRTEQLISQGAADIVYGRNVIRHADPAGMTRALVVSCTRAPRAEEVRQSLSPKGG